jgi:hypothetical protein
MSKRLRAGGETFAREPQLDRANPAAATQRADAMRPSDERVRRTRSMDSYLPREVYSNGRQGEEFL